MAQNFRFSFHNVVVFVSHLRAIEQSCMMYHVRARFNVNYLRSNADLTVKIYMKLSEQCKAVFFRSLETVDLFLNQRRMMLIKSMR